MGSHASTVISEHGDPPITIPPGDFAALYRDHAGQLLAWLAVRVRRSDIEDVHQDIWSRVCSRYASHFHGGNFRAWLFAIAKNHLVDLSRRRRDVQSLDESSSPHADPRSGDPVEIVADREHRLRLQGCLETLGQPRRGIVELRLAGDDYECIAAMLGITTPQAHSHFFAAKKLLRACLEAKGEVAR